MKTQKKSPLKDRPLRIPGQSLDEEIKRIMDDEVLSYLMLPMILILMTIPNWLLWYDVIKLPNPLVMTAGVMGFCVYSFFKMVKITKRIRSLRLGRDGERAVGQYLDVLREQGCKVFHDLMGDNFNLDHIVISKQGVFSIETKIRSKPEKGACRIIVNEQGIAVNGYKPEKNIVIQAQAQKHWLEKLITNLAGVKLTVKPVVVFPGWYIENQYQEKRNNVWVLEPKALPRFIEHSPTVLSEEKVRLISNQISRFIRSTNDELK
jgi:hypothetical protein